MKRRLHVLQALDTSAEQSSNGTADDSVERLFREKLRAKESETTRLKVSLSELEKETQELRTRLQQSEQVAEERRKLIQRLEEDLSARTGPQGTYFMTLERL